MDSRDGPTRLRRPADADADAVARAVRTSVAELAPFMPWAGDAYGTDEALTWIRDERGVEDAFVIIDSTDRPIGACGLAGFDDANRVANLGYWLATTACGRGAATRAALQVARYGFEQRDLERIEIMMAVENGPSRRVAERIGATHEGIMRHRLLLHGRHRDAHLFSVLRDDPLAST